MMSDIGSVKLMWFNSSGKKNISETQYREEGGASATKFTPPPLLLFISNNMIHELLSPYAISIKIVSSANTMT
eukprot:scaffold8323_cov46-Cyclotella_meneghiniana.AAC.1